MKITDVISVVKSGISQLTAANFYDAETPELTETDTAALVELGHSLENHTLAADIFLGALVDTLTGMRIDSRAYSAVLPSLFVDTYEWGGFREHVVIGLSDILDDEMYPINGFIGYNETGGEAEAQRIAGIEHGTFKPAAQSKFYDEGKAFMIALSTIREQLFTAVRSLSELNKLISAMQISVDNTIQLKAEVGALSTVSTGIARAIALGNEIKLVTLYNDLTGSTLSAGWEALNTPEFVAFVLETIANTEDEVKRFTAVYNNHQHVTFSNDSRLILLSRFANRAKFGVRANTYNEQLLGIGDYERVTGWQAVSKANTEPFAPETLSSISLTKSSAEKVGLTVPQGETGLTLTNIIGLLYDRYALGISLDKKKVTTSYTASQDKYNTYHHNIINYIIDDNFPMVAFTLN
jgi:hypothetical protein